MSIPSTIIPCSIGGITVEAHVNPIMKGNIMPWHLACTLLGDVTLRPSDKLLKCCPFGHIIECRGVACAVLLTLDKIEVHLDFHIFEILDSDLLIGHPLESSLTSHGSQAGLLRDTIFATAISCSENLLAKPLPEQNSLEEMMHTSPFISSEPILLESSEEYDMEDNLHSCEDERSSSTSTEFEPPPDGPESIVLNLDREITLIFHDVSLEMENQWAMESSEAPTLESKEKDSTNEHGSFTYEIPCKPCSTTLELGIFSVPCTHEDYNQLKVLFCKIFRRLVVDVYVYHKHCRFCGC